MLLAASFRQQAVSISSYKFTPRAVASPDAPQKPLVRKRARSGDANWVQVTRQMSPSKAKRPRTAGSQQPACTHKEHQILTTSEAASFANQFCDAPHEGFTAGGTQPAGLGKVEEICSHSQAGRCMPQWSPSPCGEGQQWRRFGFGTISRPLCIAPSCVSSNFQPCAQKCGHLPPPPHPPIQF